MVTVLRPVALVKAIALVRKASGLDVKAASGPVPPPHRRSAVVAELAFEVVVRVHVSKPSPNSAVIIHLIGVSEVAPVICH